MHASPLVIRVDAGPAIGLGHAMRCLALAQAYRAAGGEVHVLLAEGSAMLAPRLDREGFEWTAQAEASGSEADATATARWALERGARWVVVDGYHFDAAFQRAVRRQGLQLLVLDDFGHGAPYTADAVLNQNPSAHVDLYKQRAPWTRLYMGLEYALLRQEFLRADVAPRSGAATRLLVTMGGADPQNLTSRVLAAISSIDFPALEVRVVIGRAKPHGVTSGDPRVTLFSDPPDMPGLLAWADVAIAAAGSTCWELAYMGVPSLLVAAADNQRPLATAMAELGAAVNLGWHAELDAQRIAVAIGELLADAPLRQMLADKARQLVDGRGARRIVDQVLRPTFRLRPVDWDDASLVWEWSNDPLVRANSFQQGAIPWETHVAWLKARLADPSSLMLIAEEHGEPAGLVRFAMDGRRAEIGVSVAPARRGNGLGQVLIREGLARLFATTGVDEVDAFIRPENSSSIRAFEAAGFGAVGRSLRGEVEALHFRAERAAVFCEVAS